MRGYSQALREKFCQEYVKDLDGTNAYRRARGHNVRGAARRAYELLQEPDVKARIAELQRDIAERNKVTADEVVESLRENIRRGLQRVPVLDSKGNPTGEWRWDGAVVNRAAELLGKTIGMFTDKVETSGTMKHEHTQPYDPRVPLTEEERTRRIEEILEKGRKQREERPIDPQPDIPTLRNVWN